ncbi:MAG TPA: hypothetical protein VLH56_11390 [Dissulfurispiraceae bacterium]|nr:hypothetical protein [Dissulfurispiraceae bacterium]
MAQGTISKTFEVAVETGNVITIDVVHNTMSMQIKLLNGEWQVIARNRTDALTALGPTKKLGVQEAIDGFIADAITAAGLPVTMSNVRTMGLGYQIDAVAPQE